MDATTVQALVQKHLPDCQVEVQGEGANYDITVTGEVFEGLRPVRRQQLVYSALTQVIADGAVHAVNIRTFTADER